MVVLVELRIHITSNFFILFGNFEEENWHFLTVQTGL